MALRAGEAGHVRPGKLVSPPLVFLLRLRLARRMMAAAFLRCPARSACPSRSASSASRMACSSDRGGGGHPDGEGPGGARTPAVTRSWPPGSWEMFTSTRVPSGWVIVPIVPPCKTGWPCGLLWSLLHHGGQSGRRAGRPADPCDRPAARGCAGPGRIAVPTTARRAGGSAGAGSSEHFLSTTVRTRRSPPSPQPPALRASADSGRDR